LTWDWFARPRKTPLSPSELNREGKGQALVLRYAGCQLRESQCPLCYAWRYAWNIHNGHKYDTNRIFNSLKALSSLAKKIVWVRVQGGEPLLTYHRIITSLQYGVLAISEIYSSNLNYYSITRVVIQTNALVFNMLNEIQLNNVKNLLRKASSKIAGKGRIIFEVSFKSSNNPAILCPQANAYERLLKDILIPLWEDGVDNVAVYPLAGLGPSIDFHNVWLIPVEPKALPDEIPLFHRSYWSSCFKNLVNEFVDRIVPRYAVYDCFRANPRTNNGTKLAIEELEPTKFQSSWISRYANPSTHPPLNTLLRRISNDFDNQWGSSVLFGRNRRWLQVANSIPIASNPRKLLDLVKEMNEYFYPSHPIGHYPYL